MTQQLPLPYWHPVDERVIVDFAEADTPEERARALQALGEWALTVYRTRRYGAVPSARKLARRSGGQKDRALRTRGEALDFLEAWERAQTVKKRGGSTPPPSRRSPDRSPPPSRQVPDTSPTASRQPPDTSITDNPGEVVAPPPSARHSPDTSPTASRQPPDTAQTGVEAQYARARSQHNTTTTTSISKEKDPTCAEGSTGEVPLSSPSEVVELSVIRDSSDTDPDTDPPPRPGGGAPAPRRSPDRSPPAFRRSPDIQPSPIAVPSPVASRVAITPELVLHLWVSSHRKIHEGRPPKKTRKDPQRAAELSRTYSWMNPGQLRNALEAYLRSQAAGRAFPKHGAPTLPTFAHSAAEWLPSKPPALRPDPQRQLSKGAPKVPAELAEEHRLWRAALCSPEKYPPPTPLLEWLRRVNHPDLQLLELIPPQDPAKEREAG